MSVQRYTSQGYSGIHLKSNKRLVKQVCRCTGKYNPAKFSAMPLPGNSELTQQEGRMKRTANVCVTDETRLLLACVVVIFD